MRCCELAQVPNKKFIDGSVPHYNVPYILEDGSLRKNLEDCAAEMAAVVYSYGPWVVDVEELESPLYPKEHLANLGMKQSHAPPLPIIQSAGHVPRGLIPR